MDASFELQKCKIPLQLFSIMTCLTEHLSAIVSKFPYDLVLRRMYDIFQVAMCNFPSVKDAADVAIATMFSGIQVRPLLLNDRI